MAKIGRIGGLRCCNLEDRNDFPGAELLLRSGPWLKDVSRPSQVEITSLLQTREPSTIQFTNPNPSCPVSFLSSVFHNRTSYGILQWQHLMPASSKDGLASAEHNSAEQGNCQRSHHVCVNIIADQISQADQ